MVPFLLLSPPESELVLHPRPHGRALCGDPVAFSPASPLRCDGKPCAFLRVL